MTFYLICHFYFFWPHCALGCFNLKYNIYITYHANITSDNEERKRKQNLRPRSFWIILSIRPRSFSFNDFNNYFSVPKTALLPTQPLSRQILTVRLPSKLGHRTALLSAQTMGLAHQEVLGYKASGKDLQLS